MSSSPVLAKQEMPKMLISQIQTAITSSSQLEVALSSTKEYPYITEPLSFLLRKYASLPILKLVHLVQNHLPHLNQIVSVQEGLTFNIHLYITHSTIKNVFMPDYVILVSTTTSSYMYIVFYIMRVNINLQLMLKKPSTTINV